MPFLRKENGEQPGQCIELKADEFIIGRAPDCHLVLDPQGGQPTSRQDRPGAGAVLSGRPPVAEHHEAQRRGHPLGPVYCP